MEGWDVYIDIFVVTKTLQEVNALKEIPGRRDQGIGTLSKDPTSAFDFTDLGPVSRKARLLSGPEIKYSSRNKKSKSAGPG